MIAKRFSIGLVPMNPQPFCGANHLRVKKWLKISHRLAASFVNRDLDYEDKPRIVYPQKMLHNLEKHKQKKWAAEKSTRRQSKSRGPLLISCSRKNYNFYKGQKFKASDVQSLVSLGWKNTRRVGDYFTLMPHSQHPGIQDGERIVSFEELGLSSQLCSGLVDLGFKSPTEIQALAIPSLLRGNNVICAAETGSGKTLAYLLPVVEGILKEKQALAQHDPDSESNRGRQALGCPNTLILTPSRELTRQVMDVAESLRPYAEFVPHCNYGGQNAEVLPRKTQTPMDMLVTTPGTMSKMLRKKLVRGTNLQHIIIDESDSLLDDSFIEDLHFIFRKLQVTPVEEEDLDSAPFLIGTQIVLVSATMPRNIEPALSNLLPMESMRKITTRALHQLQPHVPQKFIRINPDSKPEKLVQLLKKSQDKKYPVLVFVKNSKTCYYVAKLLEETGLHCLRLSGDMHEGMREGVFEKFKEGYSDILVATDIASRGLDTTNVCHVINYDFPQFMSDYIHRVGRVGRMGTSHHCQVTSFVTHKWDVNLMWKIEIAARQMKTLGEVDANIKARLDSLKLHKDKFELNIV